MPSASKRQTGRDGEDAATLFLQRLGYKIVERNFCVWGGEIDIIARDENTLVFIEVKSQNSPTFGAPETWIDERKQQRLGIAAERYITDKNIEDLDCRFDVITVNLARIPPHIHHIKDAFWLEE